MKRSDKYPPGTVEDARNLPPPCTFCGLHPLVWGLLAVFCIAAVGMYSEMVGFYDVVEDMVEKQHEESPDSQKLDDQGKADDHETGHKSKERD